MPGRSRWAERPEGPERGHLPEPRRRPTRGPPDTRASATLTPRRSLGISARGAGGLLRAEADRGASPSPSSPRAGLAPQGPFFGSGRGGVSQSGRGGRAGRAGWVITAPGSGQPGGTGAGRPVGGAPEQPAWHSRPGVGVGWEEKAPPRRPVPHAPPPRGCSPGRCAAPGSERRPRAGTRRSGVPFHFTWIRFRSWGHSPAPPNLYIFPYLLCLSLHFSPYLSFFHLLIPFSPPLQSLLFPINLIPLQSLSALEILGVNKRAHPLPPHRVIMTT